MRAMQDIVQMLEINPNPNPNHFIMFPRVAHALDRTKNKQHHKNILLLGLAIQTKKLLTTGVR